MDVGLIIEWVVKSLIIILSMTGGFAYMTWYERKILARMQVRRRAPTGRGVLVFYSRWRMASS